MSLPHRTLGRTGLQVSTLGYGGIDLRGLPVGRHLASDEADRLLNTVLDEGITLVDTSIDYGLSEELIGRHLAHRRDEFVLTGKCGCAPGREVFGLAPARTPHDYRPRTIRAGVEQSLRRLRTDRLDVVQVHRAPGRSVLERDDTVAALLELKEAGKVRFLGVSSELPEIEEHLAMDVFDVFQIPYSALQPEYEAVVTRAARTGAGVIVRSGAGRVLPRPAGQADGGRQSYAEAWRRSGLDGLRGAMPPIELLLRHLLSRPDVSTVLIGSTDVAHVRENVAAAQRGGLPAGLYQAVQVATRAATSAGG
ncbi:aldo/keto reductase [Jiangella ureilytica]|uniref:Aldo/keto reductase n=1 Tax=Jiangella ureilytica TaxID=2530374 RepID=A0A4R4RW42_9ACTN|nr:aldo/keto reductase [Jiangella ureilytica]